MKFRLPALATVLGIAAVAGIGYLNTAISFSGGPPAGHTGAPGEATCVTSGCHSNTLQANTTNLSLNISGYTPGGAAVQVTLTNASRTGSRYGFQLKAVDSQNQDAGTFVAGTGQQTVNNGTNQYLEHSSPNGSGTWTFIWTPPTTNVGTVTFYVASYNGNSRTSSAGTVGTRAITLSPITSLPNPFAAAETKVYPNPASTVAQVSYALTEPNHVSLQLLDATGKSVSVHTIGMQDAGNHKYSLPLNDQLSAGVYTVRLTSNGHATSKRLVVVR